MLLGKQDGGQGASVQGRGHSMDQGRQSPLMGGASCQYTQDMAVTRPMPQGEEEVCGRVQLRERKTRRSRPVPMKKLLCGVFTVGQ